MALTKLIKRRPKGASINLVCYKISSLVYFLSACLLVVLLASHLLQATTTTNKPPTNAQKRKFQLKIQRSGAIDIPGLYDDHGGLITPIQGRSQFDHLVLGQEYLSKNGTLFDCAKQVAKFADKQTISLVQFYMATCPDCQGFSPYFKRFAGDISPHWRPLVRIYTVNCNDFENIHLCQEENPKLIVPMVRWYAPALIQAAARSGQANLELNNGHSTSTCLELSFGTQLLNVAHRKFITKQRRDLISLRRATLRYMDLMLDELRQRQKDDANSLYAQLPLKWNLLEQLDDQQAMTFRKLERVGNNNRSFASSFLAAPKSALVFEHHPSAFSMGRLAVADWSNFSVPTNGGGDEAAPPKLLVHWSADFSLLKHLMRQMDTDLLPDELRNASEFGGLLKLAQLSPISLLLEHSTNTTGPQLSLLSFNSTLANMRQQKSVAAVRSRRSLANTDQHQKDTAAAGVAAAAAADELRLGRIKQRSSLVRYYALRPSSSRLANEPARYAASMSTSGVSRLRRRSTQTKEQEEKDAEEEKRKRQADAENINWAPEILWPKLEMMRKELNEALAKRLNLVEWPGKQLAGKNPEEIPFKRPDSERGEVIDAKEDDLTLMLLTDYYKSLDEITHVDLIAKGQLDGYQLLAATCFLQTLKNFFPFQGNAQWLAATSQSSNQAPSASAELGDRFHSVARFYVNEVAQRWTGELGTALARGDEKLALELKTSLEKCPNLNSLQVMLSTTPTSGINVTEQSLSQINVSSRRLEQDQRDARKQLNVGLAPSNKMSWKYCAGSEANLRGHTCSLWILFHTLTVQEYLQQQQQQRQVAKLDNSSSSPHQEAYKFQIDYSQPPRRACDPQNPEQAFLESTSGQHYTRPSNGTQSPGALASIINFVRFFLPCTNCAAHFSCMVEHSPSLQVGLGGELAPDAHLLWLWEGHNRVNLRTKGTHSEDSLRPKHVFPVYEACPQCYLENPTLNSSRSTKNSRRLEDFKFNKRELVKFIVARYRKSAILNNKINIEDLYK